MGSGDSELIGVLSDAHGHGPAFETAIRVLGDAGARRLVFLGDAVGYIPSMEVLEIIDSIGNEMDCIAGNHDIMLSQSENSSDREAIYQHAPVRAGLPQRYREMLLSWPHSIRGTGSGNAVLYVHGSPADPTNGYVYPDTSLDEFQPNAQWVLMGHTHRPFVRHAGGTCYVNVGSCGLPRDDGRYGCACLLDLAGGTARLLRFDITGATKKMLCRYGARLHPSVIQLFERRLPRIEGEIV